MWGGAHGPTMPFPWDRRARPEPKARSTSPTRSRELFRSSERDAPAALLPSPEGPPVPAPLVEDSTGALLEPALGELTLPQRHGCSLRSRPPGVEQVERHGGRSRLRPLKRPRGDCRDVDDDIGIGLARGFEVELPLEAFQGLGFEVQLRLPQVDEIVAPCRSPGSDGPWPLQGLPHDTAMPSEEVRAGASTAPARHVVDRRVSRSRARRRDRSAAERSGASPTSTSETRDQALPPGTEVADQGQQGALAAPRGLLVVVGVVLPADQNPISSWRRWSACSRPRRGSLCRSA